MTRIGSIVSNLARVASYPVRRRAERLILLYGFLASTTKEVKRREKEEERGDD